MRIGEIRNQIKAVTDSEGHIVIDAEAIYGEQAYIVRGFKDLRTAYELIISQKWNTFDSQEIADILNQFSPSLDNVQLTQEQYAALVNYKDHINGYLPVFIATLEEFTPDQDPQIINVKLNDNITSFNKLTEINTRLDKLFKEFTIDGEIKLQGFDKGTDWYMVLLTGAYTYHTFIACLKFAQEFFITKTKYYESKQAELDYRASLKKNEQPSDDALEEYKAKRMDLEIEEKVQEILDKIPVDDKGREASELLSYTVKATKDLINTIGEGVEFHLSLNPPSYANEKGGSLTIDYKQVQKRLEKDTKKLVIPEKVTKSKKSEE